MRRNLIIAFVFCLGLATAFAAPGAGNEPGSADGSGDVRASGEPTHLAEGVTGLRGAPGVSIRDFAVRTLGRAEGLPGESVTAILQTRDGYLWVGTSAKLVRFDGLKFTEFGLPVQDTNAPARITALCEDATGKLWVGTQEDGVVRLDETGMKAFRKDSGLLDNSVTSLAADTEGRVWIGTRAGLNRWDGTGFTAFTSREGLADGLVQGVHVARSGVVWITTRSGMYQYQDGRILPYEFQTESQGRRPEFLGAYEDRRGNLWVFGDTYLINLAEGKRFNYFRGVEAAAVRIWSLCEGRDGRLWIGTSGRGLFCFSDNKFQPVSVSELHWPNDVRAICEDREGTLWLGTSGGGLMQLLPQSVQVMRAEQGLPAGAANCLAVEESGRMFVGFESGGVYLGEGGRFERLAGENGLGGQSVVTSVCAAPDGTLWIATLGHGLYGVRQGRTVHLTTLNGLADDTILAVCALPDGAIWAGTRGGALNRIYQGEITTLGRSHGLPGTPITALLPARPGGFWLGTEDGQVLRYQSESFNLVHRVAATMGQSILTLHEDSRGRLWIGTKGAGLACWIGQRCLTWTTQNGLPDDCVYGVLDDAEGDLWLATPRGIYRTPREVVQEAMASSSPLRGQLMFELKKASDQPVSFGGPRALPAADGKLWFATPEGLIAVDKSGQNVTRSPPPPVYIEKILVNGQPLRALTARVPAPDAKRSTAPVRLPLDLEALEFQFTAPSFVSPEKVNFRHKLEGFDRDWVGDGTERRVRYGRLSYGDYRFRVAASQPDGTWNEGDAPFAFVVPTPLWRTPAALALYFLAVFGTVAGIVRLVSNRRLRRQHTRHEQQQALDRERMRIAQDMHDDLGSKLTKISFLSERMKLERGVVGPIVGQIESIAHTSRELLQTLDEIVWAVNPRNDSLEHLAAYLNHYAVEYFQNTAVYCEMRLPRDIPHHPLTAEVRHNLFLTFEEALNNALKHAAPRHVNIEMTVDAEGFAISITDDGRGFDPAAVPALRSEKPLVLGRRGGNGMVNMRQRLAEVGGRCEFRSQPGHGTTVSLHIPLPGAQK